jgi:hypothetical protein
MAHDLASPGHSDFLAVLVFKTVSERPRQCSEPRWLSADEKTRVERHDQSQRGLSEQLFELINEHVGSCFLIQRLQYIQSQL